MVKTIQEYLKEIEAKYNATVAKVYSDFLFNLYRTSVDAFVEQSIKNNFSITAEWVQEHMPHLNLC